MNLCERDKLLQSPINNCSEVKNFRVFENILEIHSYYFFSVIYLHNLSVI